MSISKIVCCTDFSETADQAFHMAIDMAEKFSARLFVVHVIPPVVNPLKAEQDPDIYEKPGKSLILKVEERMQQEYGQRIEKKIAYLFQKNKSLKKTPQIDYEFVVLSGHISTEILDFLEKKGIDLVILGSYGLTGMGLVVFGSVAKRISHKSPCSVMIVRGNKDNQ